MQQMTMTGGEALVRSFQAFGNGPMFGMGGFQLLPFYDAARRLGFEHHLINDERAGIFAADAYAKVSGRVGLVDATLGPGATNLATGLMEAFNAGTPLVALVGDAHRMHAWKNMTQECRQLDVLRPVCKELIRVECIERIPELVQRAFAVATTGRPGPVVLAVPEDISHAEGAFHVTAFEAPACYARAPALRCRPSADTLDEAIAALRSARAPMILAGGGVHLSGAHAALTELARSLAIPVAHTLSGKGAVACTDDISAGLFGRYDRVANRFIDASDVLLVVGCKLGEVATRRYEIPRAGKTVIHLDVLAEEFDRTTRTAIRLWGDAREGLQDLLAGLQPWSSELRSRWSPRVQELRQAMGRWREEVSGRLDNPESPVDMARLMTAINRVLPAEGYLVADGGFAAHWGGLLFDSRRAGRSFVPDRGSASIGYGLPGAIGACMAARGAPVLALTGDGGFNMMLGEMETALRLGLAPTIVVVNNAASGYIKALQHLMYGAGAYHCSDLRETNYAAIAQSMGCLGIRIESPDTLEEALRGALTSPLPVVIDVVVTRDPARMLPGVDSRAAKIHKGDRIA